MEDLPIYIYLLFGFTLPASQKPFFLLLLVGYYYNQSLALMKFI